jgi:hypothetical protein
MTEAAGVAEEEEELPSILDRIRAALASPLRVIAALVMPDRWVPRQVSAQRYGAAFAVVIVCGLVQAGAVGWRLDVAPDVLARAAAAAAPRPGDDPGQAPQAKSDREVQEEIAKTLAVKRVTGALSAGLLTPLKIVLLAIVAYLILMWVKGAPTFPRTLTAASHAALPGAAKALVGAAAAVGQTAITPAQAAELVPNPLAPALASVSPVLARLGDGVDPFTLWAVVILGFGAASAAEMPRWKAFVVVVVCFLLYLAISNLIMGGPPPGAGPGPMRGRP